MSKYYKGNPIRCTYSPEFRSLVYKINPHDMSCMYKTMFEVCATDKLRGIDEPDDSDEVVPVMEPKHHASSLTELPSNEIERWKVCDQTHKWLPDSLDGVTMTGGCNQQLSSASKTLRSQSAYAKLEYHSIKDDRMNASSQKPTNTPCRKTFSTDAVSSSRVECRLLSSHLSTLYCSATAQIPYTFKHHSHYTDHMDQYREQYTQRRIRTLRTSVNDYRCYNGILSAPQILQRSTFKLPTSTQSASTSPAKSYDVFDNLKDVPVNSNSLHPSQKRVAKKKSMKSQTSQNNHNPLRRHQPLLQVHCQQTGVVNMDEGSGYSKIYTEDMIPEPEINHRLPSTVKPKLTVSCRTRPTIPSKSHSAATDQPSYVVTYLRK